jgi:DNA repair protein RecN (Recombination protein N)
MQLGGVENQFEFERDELTAADPKPGEVDELTREAHRLANTEQLRTAAAEGYSLLYESEHSAQWLLEEVARALGPLASSVPELLELGETLERLADEAREVAYSLRSLSQNWDDDPERLEEVEGRLALYRRLASRFRCAPDELAAKRAEVEGRLDAIEHDDADLRGLDASLARAWSALKQAAEALSSGRRKTAKAFARAIQSRLKPLGLAGARLDVEIETTALGDDATAGPAPEFGVDRVEIVFSANTGEAARPLRKVASGGELSRVTLAVKTVLAAADKVPTLVFDEIDSGVGGRLGAVLGKTLVELSRYHQVICVTHLPQMASYARKQWVIRKHVTRGRTTTTITPLDDDARVAELAAMLRGDSAAEGTRQEARAMLLEARRRRS